MHAWIGVNMIETQFFKGENPILARRWALNCAVAFFSDSEAQAEDVIEVAMKFENYLRGGAKDARWKKLSDTVPAK